MVTGTYPVYCRTAPGRCRTEDILLGIKPMNTPAQCPICGRWSVAERIESVERST
jgi:hypothetical protein